MIIVVCPHPTPRSFENGAVLSILGSFFFSFSFFNSLLGCWWCSGIWLDRLAEPVRVLSNRFCFAPSTTWHLKLQNAETLLQRSLPLKIGKKMRVRRELLGICFFACSPLRTTPKRRSSRVNQILDCKPVLCSRWCYMHLSHLITDWELEPFVHATRKTK